MGHIISKILTVTVRGGVALLAAATCGAAFASVTISAGEGWTPIRGTTRIWKGSALDFSDFAERREAAGAHGRVVVRNGRFELEHRPGVPCRFYGVNLCFSANFPTPAEAEDLCTRLSRIGYNALRIHHYERTLCEGAADGTAINSERMEQLDNLLAAAARHGLYVTTDLYVSRAVPYRACGIDRDGIIPMADYKELVLCHEGACSNLVAFAKAFLGHVNCRTSRRWADEPALMSLALVNEGNPGNHGLAASRRLFGVSTNEMSDAAFVRHMVACQRRFDDRMIDVLRTEIGYRGLVSNLSCWNNPPELQEARRSYDYVDDHFYVDHPRFLEKSWCLPSECRNENPLTYENAGVSWRRPVRLDDRPYVITEWNFSGPGRYRGVGGIVFGAGAALQDMDGAWRFAWSHARERALKDAPMGYFDAASDPLMLATERAVLALFLRGDMPVDRSVERPRACERLSVDVTNGTFIVRTPRTEAVVAEASEACHRADRLSVVVRGHAAAVWVTSLDGRDIGVSRHLLVTHLTDAQDSGTVYRTAERKVLERWGRLPHLMANGTAEISIRGSYRRAKVHALESDGTRRGEVPQGASPYGLSFTADIARDAQAATCLYEIVVD